MDPCRVGLWSVLLLFQTVCADLSSPRYAVHQNRVSFAQALESCVPGVLTTIATETEVTEVLRAVSRSALRQNQFTFWVGLRRVKNECVFPTLPLRGFRWTSDGSQDSQVSRWIEEPKLTCTTIQCAALSGETNSTTVTSWGLVPVTCRKSYSFICKRTPEDQEAEGPDATESGPDRPVAPELEKLVTSGPHKPVTPELDKPVTSGPDKPIAQNPELPTSGTEPEREKDLKSGPKPRPGSDLVGESDSCQKPSIPGTRSLSLDPGNRGWVQVECWSQVQVELQCSGRPGSWRFLDDSPADLLSVCQPCEDGFLKDTFGKCVDRDECADDPCRTTCLNTVGSFRCVCTDKSGNHHDQDSPLCLQHNSGEMSQDLILGLVAAAVLVVLVVVAAVTVKCCLMRRANNKDGGESLETAN